MRGDVELMLTEGDLYLLHEAVSMFLPYLSEQMQAGVRDGDLLLAMDLDQHIKGVIDDLQIAAGGDPRG